MNQHFNREKQQKILEKLKCNHPNFTSEEGYDEIFALFGDERELNRHLQDMKSRGLITVHFIESMTGYVCEISSLAYIQR